MSLRDAAPTGTRPAPHARVLAALMVLLAVGQVLWSLVLRLGVPVAVVGVARFTKEALVAALVVLALQQLWRGHRPGRSLTASWRGVGFDGVDATALAYLCVVGVYLAVGLLVGASQFPRATDSPSLLLVSTRALVAAPVMVLVTRSLRWTAADRRLVLRTIVGIAAVLSVGAVIEGWAPGLWGWLGRRVVEYDVYQRQVLGVTRLQDVVVQTTFGNGVLVTRAGSLLYDYLQLGFFLLPAFALLFVRVARGKRGATLALFVLVGIGILATVTRTAIFAAVLVLIVIAVTVPRRAVRARVRRVAAVTLVLALLVAVPSGIGARMLAGLRTSDASSGLHEQALALGTSTVLRAPQGVGIGSTAEVGSRTDATSLIVENAYLDIAIQVGVLGVLTFLAFLLAVGWAVRARVGEDALAGPALAVTVAMAAGSLLLPVWLMFETNWMVFALVGMALPRRASATA